VKNRGRELSIISIRADRARTQVNVEHGECREGINAPSRVV